MLYETYQTCQDDMLDQICQKHYGTEAGYTELVLSENSHLFNQPLKLPMGLIIRLPMITSEPATAEESWQLWT